MIKRSFQTLTVKTWKLELKEISTVFFKGRGIQLCIINTNAMSPTLKGKYLQY